MSIEGYIDDELCLFFINLSVLWIFLTAAALVTAAVAIQWCIFLLPLEIILIWVELCLQELNPTIVIDYIWMVIQYIKSNKCITNIALFGNLPWLFVSVLWIVGMKI